MPLNWIHWTTSRSDRAPRARIPLASWTSARLSSGTIATPAPGSRVAAMTIGRAPRIARNCPSSERSPSQTTSGAWAGIRWSAARIEIATARSCPVVLARIDAASITTSAPRPGPGVVPSPRVWIAARTRTSISLAAASGIPMIRNRPVSFMAVWIRTSRPSTPRTRPLVIS